MRAVKLPTRGGTMAVEAATAAPWGVVMAAEVRRIGLGVRPLALPIALLLLGFGGWAVYDYHAAGVAMSWSEAPFLPLLITWALCLRILFLHEKDVKGYMLAMPVGRRRTGLTTLASGWVWVMLLVTVYVAGCVLLVELTGPNYRAEGRLPFTWPPPSLLVGYAVPYVAVTVLYLVVCAPVVFARRPMGWVIWSWVLFWVYNRAREGTEGAVLGFFANDVLGRGRYGLMTALLGKWKVADHSPVREVAPGMVLSFDTSGWLMAAGVWLGVVLVAAAVLAGVHREA